MACGQSFIILIVAFAISSIITGLAYFSMVSATGYAVPAFDASVSFAVHLYIVGWVALLPLAFFESAKPGFSTRGSILLVSVVLFSVGIYWSSLHYKSSFVSNQAGQVILTKAQIEKALSAVPENELVVDSDNTLVSFRSKLRYCLTSHAKNFLNSEQSLIDCKNQIDILPKYHKQYQAQLHALVPPAKKVLSSQTKN